MSLASTMAPVRWRKSCHGAGISSPAPGRKSAENPQGKGRLVVQITEVRVKLVEDKSERLKAFCTMTLDSEFVIRDIKIIQGTRGLFVAMPSRKVADHCPRCNTKNSLQAKFCNECGRRLEGGRFQQAAVMGDKMHSDIAHPINKECRARIESALLAAYEEELTQQDAPAPASADWSEDEGNADNTDPNRQFGAEIV